MVMQQGCPRHRNSRGRKERASTAKPESLTRARNVQAGREGTTLLLQRERELEPIRNEVGGRAKAAQVISRFRIPDQGQLVKRLNQKSRST